MNEKKQIMFLFGAGTEGRGNFNLPTGFQYLKSSLFGNEFKSDITDSLARYFDKGYFNDSYRYQRHIYSNYSALLNNLIKTKVIDNPNLLLQCKKDIAIVLSKSDFKELKEYDELKEIIIRNKIEHLKENKDKREEINSEFREIITGKRKTDISGELMLHLFDKNDKGEIVVDMNVCIGGLLDEYFHTIISPPKYGKIQFARIFNYYWLCYFAIVEPIAKYYMHSVKDLEPFFDEERLNYFKVIQEIESFTAVLYSIKKLCLDEDNYYCVLKKAIQENEQYAIGCVATTNYFRFCETLVEEPIYLNGSLKLFEIPELLEVVDVTTEKINRKYMYFPFIFGQSLVKPIVNNKQIETMMRFEKGLETADILVILGYNINEDDNHINAFLHSYAKSEKKLIVVGDASKEKGQKEIAKKLKCNSTDVDYCSVCYGDNKQVVDSIFEIIKSY